MCFLFVWLVFWGGFFVLFSKHSLKIFYSTHLLFLLFGLGTYKHA